MAERAVFESNTAPRWFWAAPYFAVVVFVIVALAIVWLLQVREAEGQRAAIARDVLWVEKTIRLQKQASEVFLRQLAIDISRGALDEAGLRQRVLLHRENNGQLVAVVWQPEASDERWSAPGGESGARQRPRSVSESAPRLDAGPSGELRYREPYLTEDRNMVLEVAVAVDPEGGRAGTVSGIFSIDRMMRDLVPDWFSDRYRLALVDSAGGVLAVNPDSREVDRGIAFDVPLDLTGAGLSLQAVAFRSAGQSPHFLSKTIILGLSLVVLGTLWRLRAHMRRRVQVEKERDRLFNLSLDLLSIIGADGRFRRCNPAFRKVLGYDPEALPGRALVDLIHDEDIADTRTQLERLASGEAVSFENRCRCADGTYKWLVWNMNPVTEENLLYAVAHDVTRRKATEDALREESSFRKAMEESVITGMRAIDLSGRIIYVNPAFCRMVGFDENELVGSVPPFPYWPEDQVEAYNRNLEIALAGRAPASGFDMRIRRKTGELLDARFYLSPLIDLTGKQTGWMASIADVSEPKRTREALMEAQKRFEAVLDGLDASVFVADVGTDEILFANRAFKNIYGFDAVGRTIRGVAAPQPGRADYKVDPHGLNGAILPLELSDGEVQHPLSGRWYHVREHATRWVDGRVVRMGIATDITDRKQGEEAARQQEKRLQHTSRLITMGEMASTLAHELNQPLAAIANYCMGCVTRIQGGNFRNDEILAAMQKASFQAERAGKIVRRVRDFVRKSEPRRSAVRLADVLDDAIGFADIDARRIGGRIVLDVEPGLPPVYADRIMIEQVIINLLRNGLDSMAGLPSGERLVTVRARLAGPRAISIAVADRGVGIGEEQRELLFTPFYTTKAEGMGMGLNICRSIVEYHDGHLTVEANPEGGTIFTFTLPTGGVSECVARSA